MRSTHPLIKSISNLILFLFLESVCLLLIFNNGITQKYILLEKSREIQKNFWERTQKIKNYSKLKEVNENLSLENLDLYKEKEFYKNELSKIKGEEYLNSFKDSASNITSYDFLWAKVIKNTLNSAHNYLIIDRGSDDGIVEDMGVITKNGVVGVMRSVGQSCYDAYSL